MGYIDRLLEMKRKMDKNHTPKGSEAFKYGSSGGSGNYQSYSESLDHMEATN